MKVLKSCAAKSESARPVRNLADRNLNNLKILALDHLLSAPTSECLDEAKTNVTALAFLVSETRVCFASNSSWLMWGALSFGLDFVAGSGLDQKVIRNILKRMGAFLSGLFFLVHAV